MSKPKSFNKTLINTLKIIVGVGLLVFLLKGVDFQQLLNIIIEGKALTLIFAVLSITLAQVYLQSFRFHYIIKKHGFPFRFSLNLALVGLFFNNLLPTAVGGDIVRTVLLREKANISYSESLTYVILHRFSGLASLSFLFFFYVAFNIHKITELMSSIEIGPSGNYLVVFAIVFVVIAIALIFFRTRLLSMIRTGIHTVRNLKIIEVVVIFLLAILYHSMTILGIWLLVSFVGETIRFFDLIVVQTFTAFVSLIPISIGALGLLEGTISGLLTLYDVNEMAAIAVALLIRILLIGYALWGLSVSVFNSEFHGLLKRKRWNDVQPG